MLDENIKLLLLAKMDFNSILAGDFVFVNISHESEKAGGGCLTERGKTQSADGLRGLISIFLPLSCGKIATETKELLYTSATERIAISAHSRIPVVKNPISNSVMSFLR